MPIVFSKGTGDTSSVKTMLLSFVASFLVTGASLPQTTPHRNASPIFYAHGYSNEEEIDLHLYGLAEEESDPIFC